MRQTQARHHMDRSDLLDWAHHEHEHLDRLFEDLRRMFDEIDDGTWAGDDLDAAVEDLRGALEDMLEHFSEEEEVYFVAIETRFPEYAEDLAVLERHHASICERTRGLKRQIAREDPASRIQALKRARDELDDELAEHNVREQDVFRRALERLTQEERVELLDTKLSLG